MVLWSISHQIGAQNDFTTSRSRGNCPLASASSYFLRSASFIGRGSGPLLGLFVAFLGGWILFKTQLDILDGLTRAITDILWTASSRIRAARGADVRVVYYAVLAVVVIWGIIALRLTQSIILLQLGANMAGIVFIVASLHLLYVNTRLLPVELRPPLWRRLGLVSVALFYGLFVTLWLANLA